MLPSNAAPITEPSRAITGDPELPPMMSLVVTKSITVAGSSLACAAAQRGVRSNGGAPVARV